MPCALPAAATSMPVLRRCRGLRARGWMAILAATVTGAVVHLDARAQRRRAVRVAHANVAHWEMQGRGVTFDDQLRRRGREHRAHRLTADRDRFVLLESASLHD